MVKNTMTQNNEEKEKKCQHKNRTYSTYGYSLTVNPPINVSPWICKDCGFEGADRSHSYMDDEYGEVKRKFRK